MKENMLKQLFKQKFKYTKCFSTQYSPCIWKIQISKPKDKILSVCFHTSNNNEKLFAFKENSYAFNIINKDYLMKEKILPNRNYEIDTLEQFNDILDRDWRGSSASEIVRTFKNVKNFCIENNIALSDNRFDKLTDGLMDHCENLTGVELLDILTSVAEFPLCESYNSHNFHDIWSCLDDVCCCKMVEWDIETCFAIADVWYKLNLAKLCDFIFVLIDRLTKKADGLTKEQLINVLFYFNVCRKRAVDFEYEYALEKHIKNMNIDEMAIVAMGYFKTRTKIKVLPILQAMVEKVTENSRSIHEISLSAILKVLRLSKPIKLIPEINFMLSKLSDEITRLSDLCCLHIALISTGLQTYHSQTVKQVAEKIVVNIPNKDIIRLKDIERILNVLSMYDFDPKTVPDIFRVSYLELHKKHRLEEELRYVRSLVSALNFLSLRNIYSHELMNKLLDAEYIADTFGKSAKMVPRDLFSLDCSIDIECPGYSGNRLSPHLKYKCAKWLTEFTPSHSQYKKITSAERLILDTIDTVKVILGDEKYMFVNHVLPHFSKADIILCKNKSTGRFIEPCGFHNYVLGDVMFPFKNSNLEWLAIVIVGWNSTIRGTGLPLGSIIMKKTIGESRISTSTCNLERIQQFKQRRANSVCS